MANATSTQLQELYVAYFGRAADPTGLDYWTTEGITTSKFAADMYAQAEFKYEYGSLTTEQQVDQIYQNLFDRAADVTGLTYWTLQIDLGKIKLAEIANHLIYAAQNNAGSESDKTALANKTSAAIAYTAKVKETTAAILAYAPETVDSGSGFVKGANLEEGTTYLSGINGTTTHTAAGIASSVTTITDNGVLSTRLTFDLTTNADTFTGKSGNDIFTGDNTGSNKTSTADTLDGGTGTDKVKIYSDGTIDALPKLISVETLELYDADTNTDFSATNQSSVTTVNLIRSDGTVTHTVGANVTTIGLEDHTLAGAGIGLTLDAEDTTVVLNTKAIGVGGEANTEDITLTGADLATVTINALTSTITDEFDVAGASAINLNASAVFTTADLQTTSTTGTLTITGSGAVTLGAMDVGIDTITATAATGAISFTAPTNNEAFVANLGSGNDTVTTSDDGFNTGSIFNIDAGAGTADKLVVAHADDISTSDEAGRYDNFEVLSTTVTQDVSLISGITSIEVGAANTITVSGLNATQASSVTFTAANTTSTVLSLTDETGEDSITINATSATTTTNFDLIGIDANYETVNFNATTGTDGTNSNIGFLRNTSDDIEALNIAGSADVELIIVDGTFDTQAVTIDASGLTGTGDLTITQTDAVLYTGSTVTGSDNGDTIALTTTLGSTYNTGGGNDALSGALALLVTDGEDDTVLNGGAGTDTITLSDAGATLTDNHFNNVTGFEKLTLSAEATTVSITSGSAFNTQAYADGVTITAATVTADAAVTIAMGTYDQGATIAITHEGDGAEAAKDEISITTGDGADTITLSAGSFVGGGGATSDGASIVISTDGGNDTISVTTGTIVAQETSEILTIDAGPGADTLNLTTNSIIAEDETSANIVIAAGDSLTTGRDDINGFDMADGTNLGMELQFSGSAVVSDFTASNDFGTILSHNITSGGLVTFDDIASFTTALVINSANLSDVTGYLAANMDNLDTIVFNYDSNNTGATDSAMVFNKHTDGNSLVELGANTAIALTTDVDAVTASYIAIS